LPAPPCITPEVLDKGEFPVFEVGARGAMSCARERAQDEWVRDIPDVALPEQQAVAVENQFRSATADGSATEIVFKSLSRAPEGIYRFILFRSMSKKLVSVDFYEISVPLW
jgi:hypothetical protein